MPESRSAPSSAAGSAPVYGARNVVNAPSIKSAIAARSVARGDSPEVAQWLGSHFYRHVIGNLQADADTLLPIDSVADAQQTMGHKLPDWVLHHFQTAPRAAQPPHGASPTEPSQRLWWIDPHADDVLALESRLLEFLNSRRGTALEGKLMRVNAPQALAQWEAEHRAFEALQQQGWREHTPAAVQPLWRGEHGCFVELMPSSPHLRDELAYESQCMRHCVGQFANRRDLTGGYGEHYASACEAGEMRLFSYRTHALAQPHITLSAHVRAGGALAFDQIKGKQNRPPVAKYHADVLAFLRSLPTVPDETPHDALGMDLIRVPSGWSSIAEVREETDQLALLRSHPDKVVLLRQPSPLVLWLSLAQAPADSPPQVSDPAAAATLAMATSHARSTP